MITKNNFKQLLLCFLCIAGQACNRKLNDQEFLAFAKDFDNNIHKTIVVGEWNYDVQYKPSRLIVINERITNADEFIKREKQLSGTVWFNISIKHVKENCNPLKFKVSGTEEYNERLDYFLNAAREEITLDYGNTRLKPTGYLFENNYGLTPNETMVVGFEIPDEAPREDMLLVYNDRLLRNGIIKIMFYKKDTKKISLL